MNVWMSIEKPKEAVATLTVSMKISEWEELAAQMPNDKYPGWEFRRKIADVVQKVSQTFHAEVKL